MSPKLGIIVPDDLDSRLRQAVAMYWGSRRTQKNAQVQRGSGDRGSRAAVTGGQQMDGFADLLADLLTMNGVPASAIFRRKAVELPGYFRATKKWDMLVLAGGRLYAAVEMKSQVGSLGNNANNRAEEAVGSATDLWTAYRERAFGDARRPWLGYLFLLEDSTASTSGVRVDEPHFPVFPEFRDASYAKRYEELCRRLVMEGLYSDSAFLMSARDDFAGASLSEPSPMLRFDPFVRSLLSSLLIAG